VKYLSNQYFGRYFGRQLRILNDSFRNLRRGGKRPITSKHFRQSHICHPSPQLIAAPPPPGLSKTRHHQATIAFPSDHPEKFAYSEKNEDSNKAFWLPASRLLGLSELKTLHKTPLKYSSYTTTNTTYSGLGFKKHQGQHKSRKAHTHKKWPRYCWPLGSLVGAKEDTLNSTLTTLRSC